jgi:rod shape-determining protein MreD
MKRRIIFFLIIFGTFVLQTVLGNLLPDNVATPNLLLILSVSMGFMRGKKSGMWTGLVSGLFVDLFFGNVFGLNALLLMYVGYLSGLMYKMFFDNDIRIPMVAVAASDFVYNILFFVVSFAIHHRLKIGAYLMGTIFSEVVSSVIFTIGFYWIYYWLNKKIVAGELEEEQSPWLRR